MLPAGDRMGEQARKWEMAWHSLCIRHSVLTFSQCVLLLSLILYHRERALGGTVFTRGRQYAQCFTFVILFKDLYDSFRQKLTLILFYKWGWCPLKMFISLVLQTGTLLNNRGSWTSFWRVGFRSSRVWMGASFVCVCVCVFKLYFWPRRAAAWNGISVARPGIVPRPCQC